MKIWPAAPVFASALALDFVKKIDGKSARLRKMDLPRSSLQPEFRFGLPNSTKNGPFVINRKLIKNFLKRTTYASYPLRR